MRARVSLIVMEVTIVDSEPAVVNLIDTLDNLPAQPPSLYLDLEGVNLSRHGSVSILQLFVLPRNHVFLVDVFVLKEAAFSTSNRSGRDLRSILESAWVPKVFFDVRNDSDALFAHFQISMQGVQDIQLLEVATRSSSRNRVYGLATCIKNDARLTPEALAAWKATKQQGQSLFAPENGGHHEVFNFRPIPQDIVDYCTQDVVYLPVLWKRYTRKISVRWMEKVQIETCRRVVASQNASYEPHSREKTLSPWAKVEEPKPGERPGTNEAKASVKKSVMSNAKTAAIEAPKKAGSKEQSPKAASQTAGLRRSAPLAGSVAAKKAPEVVAGLERPLPKVDLAIRSKNELEPGSVKKTDAVLHPPTGHRKWACTTCGREMRKSNKAEHVAGKQHIARLKQRTATLQTDAPKQKTLRATTATVKNRQLKPLATEANPQGTTNPGSAQGASTKGKQKKKKKQTAVPRSQQNGLPSPPDYLFFGFQESAVPRNYKSETSWSLDDADYSVCDKDCGWCGHCIYEVDVDI